MAPVPQRTADEDRETGLRALPHQPGAQAAPDDELILRQIHETVRRVAAATLRGTTGHDALASAEDIAQETLITLHQRGLPGPGVNPVAWALGIARLKCKEALRRSRRVVAQQPLPEAEFRASEHADDQVVGLMHYVWLLDHLAPLDRMIVSWRQAGYSSREIAQELQQVGWPEMTANNVDQRFYRALRRLRQRVFEDDQGRGVDNRGENA